MKGRKIKLQHGRVFPAILGLEAAPMLGFRLQILAATCLVRAAWRAVNYPACSSPIDALLLE